MKRAVIRAMGQWRHWAPIVVLMLIALLGSGCTMTAGEGSGAGLSLQLTTDDTPQQLTGEVQLLLLLTVLSLAPSILVLMTGFVRIIVVLSVLRSAVGIQQLPPNQVLIGLALFLTMFVMQPVWQDVYQNALQPLMTGEIAQNEAAERAMEPVRAFMFRQVREEDLALFLRLSDAPRPRNTAEVPNHVLLPAFVISELRTAFQMAFVIYIPFLVIDLVVSSAVMAMGMMMLPPALISLPFKLLLFVMVDGWHLLVRSLVLSFGR